MESRIPIDDDGCDKQPSVMLRAALREFAADLLPSVETAFQVLFCPEYSHVLN